MITHDEAYTRLVYGDKVVWHEKQFLEDYIRQNEQREKIAQKEHELLELYDKFMYHVVSGNMMVAYRIQEKILTLKKEIEEMK